MDSADDTAPGIPADPDLGTDVEALLSPGERRARAVQVVAAVGCGGALGALGRYAISLALPTQVGRFPWGTFLVNLSGSALLGFVVICLIERFSSRRLARPLLATGVIGAYTTFSTYVVEGVLLVRSGHVVTAVTYVVASALLGLLAVWLGMRGARAVMRSGAG